MANTDGHDALDASWVEAFPYLEVAHARDRDGDWDWQMVGDEGVDPTRPPRAFSGEVPDARAAAALGALSSLEHVDLSHLWSAPAAELAVLTRLPALRWLSLEGNDLGRHLPVLPQLEVLDLSLCDLNDPRDCEPLAGYARLRRLSLSGAEVPAAGLVHLAELPALEELDLANVVLDDATAGRLAPLTGLRKLDLTGCSASAETLRAGLTPLTRLEELDLSHAEDPPDLTPLAGMTRLRVLDLSGVEGPLDLAPLAGLTELSELRLAGAHLVGEGLAPLAGLTSLRSLDLERAHVTDDDLLHLRGLTGLQRLLLSGCDASAAALEALGEALPGLSIAPGLPSECAVAVERRPPEELDPEWHDELTDVWRWIPIEEYAATDGLPIRAIDLEASEVTDAALRTLASLPHLELVSLSCCYELSDAGLEQLLGLERLRVLDLSSTNLTPAGLARLAGLRALEALSLDGVDLSGGGAEHLASLTQLEVLNLSATMLRPDDVAHLGTLAGLRELDLSHTECGAGLAPLARCTQLRKLNLSQVPIGAAGLEFLRPLTELTELELDGTGAGQDLSPLAELRRLKRLDLSSGAEVTSVEALSGLTALEELDLEGNPGLSDLTPLAPLTALRELDLAGTGVTRLAPLAGAAGLKTLHAARTPLGAGALTGLSALRDLEDLDLAHTPLPGEELAHLAGCGALQTLDLAGTQVGDAGLEHVARLPKLETLTLRGTRLSDAGLPVLRRARALIYLDLRGTWIDREAGLALREAIPTLELLQLPGDDDAYLASERQVAGRPVRDYPGERLRDPAGVAYRIRASSFDPEFPVGVLLDRLLAEPRAAELEALVIGSWEECYEQGSAPIVEHLVRAAPRLPRLQALFLGDMSREECELSWILQTDVAPLLAAYPGLTWFGVRGGNQLALSEPPRHEALQTLVIETAGLPTEVLQAVCAAHLPALERLELWLGTEENGAAEVEQLLPILSGKLFPRLRHLALRNSDQEDAVAQAVAAAPVLEQLESLDLSLGTLGDAGAEALLASPGVQRLRALNLDYNFISEPTAARFAALGPEVALGDRQVQDDELRFVAAGE